MRLGRSRLPLVLALMALGAVLFAGLIVAQEAEEAEKAATPEKPAKVVKAKDAEPAFEYVGAKKCKMCHSKEAGGDQYGKWEAGPHAKAFEVLASEKAIENAKQHEIENPQQAPQCLKCHVTAFPVMADLANQKITLEEGVSCESCHGAGSAYYKKTTMEELRAGTIEPAAVGLVMPTEEVCTGCHTPEGNDFYKEFKFDEYVKQIAHPIPEATE